MCFDSLTAVVDVKNFFVVFVVCFVMYVINIT